MRLNTLIFIFLIFAVNNVDAESNFKHVQLERGLSVDIPKDWHSIPERFNTALETHAEAAMEQLKLNDSGSSSKKLLAIISRTPLYAQVRIESTMPPDVKKSVIAPLMSKNKKANETELKIAMQDLIEKMLPIQGQKLLVFYDTRIENFHGEPAIISSYKRTGMSGPVLVESVSIYTNQQQITMTLSCRESEKILWNPVFEKIKKSLNIPS
jgi:hypothetical protein